MSAADSTSGLIPLPGIIWCAVSSEEQAKDDKTSLETQERDARKFAEENGIQIVDLLTVGGFSRRYYTYAEFVEAAALDEFYDPARMFEHWRKADFDVLIARAGDRFGREQSIFSEFVNRTIDSGARLYLLNEGWVDTSNRRMYAAMSGYGASTQVDNLRRGQKETKLKSVSRGLTVGNACPYSHKWVRNEAGKLIRLELDESKRRLWDDLATVFLEGLGYRFIEQVLYERYGHVDMRTGKPFTLYFFYHLLHNPYFWGHAARGYKTSYSKNGQKVGAWVYDPASEAPEGVTIFYNVNEPVYTGELAGKIKDELRRRALAIQGTARPHRTHKFTGLLVCDYCGHYLVFDGHISYRCQSIREVRSSSRCDRFRTVTENKIQRWIHAQLTMMLEQNLPDLLARDDNAPDFTRRIDTLKHEIDELQRQARALVVKQAQAHSALSSIYDEQLQTIGDRMEILQHTLAQTEREARSQDTSAVKAAFHELPSNLDEMWQWESTAINQLLHRLMGRRRLVVKDGMIIATRDAPAHPKRKERKRTHFGK